MLAILDGLDAGLGTHFRNAGRIDDDIEQRIGKDQVIVIGDGDLAAFDGAGHCGFCAGFSRVFLVAIGGADSFESVGQSAGRKSADFDALHPRHLRDDVGAHFASANQTDADRLAGFRSRCEIARQSYQCHICRHETLRKTSRPLLRGNFVTLMLL